MSVLPYMMVEEALENGLVVPAAPGKSHPPPAEYYLAQEQVSDGEYEGVYGDGQGVWKGRVRGKCLDFMKNGCGKAGAGIKLKASWQEGLIFLRKTRENQAIFILNFLRKCTIIKGRYVMVFVIHKAPFSGYWLICVNSSDSIC